MSGCCVSTSPAALDRRRRAGGGAASASAAHVVPHLEPYAAGHVLGAQRRGECRTPARRPWRPRRRAGRAAACARSMRASANPVARSVEGADVTASPLFSAATMRGSCRTYCSSLSAVASGSRSSTVNVLLVADAQHARVVVAAGSTAVKRVADHLARRCAAACAAATSRTTTSAWIHAAGRGWRHRRRGRR